MVLRIFAFAPLIVTVTATNAQFVGDYAPETWTVTGAGLVGGSAAFTTDGSSLTIVGGDEGASGAIDVSHAVATDGTWSFTWSYTSLDSSPGFDYCYYVINGEEHFLADVTFWSPPVGGHIAVDVKRGDVIGWGVVTTEGVFGPGTLVITDFQIPAAGMLPLLGFIGLLQTRRRE